MSQAGKYGDGTTAPEIETLTGDIGGIVGPDGFFNIDILGGIGTTVTGNPVAHTITIDATGLGLDWTREVGAAISMVIDHGYINTNAGLTTFTLPVTAALGTLILITGEGVGGWTTAQNAGQSIQFGGVSTTVGVGGSLSSTNRYDTVMIACRIANTTWSVLSNVGILNVV